MPSRRDGTKRIANVAPTTRTESVATRAIHPTATSVADRPNPAAAPLSQSAGYPATRNAASVALDPKAATDRARRPLLVIRTHAR